MKLVMITSVEEFHDDILHILKKAGIQNFSESEIDGYKKPSNILASSNWFTTTRGATNSIMLFSFTEKEKIETLFALLKEYNQNMETNNPIKAIVVPIEKSL